MASILQEIRAAIRLEIAATPKHLDFKVVRSEREGLFWKVFVDLDDHRGGGLDESLEGAAAWWGGPPKGTADVLSVDPEHEQINLRFATAPPPDSGQLIRIYPPLYLEALDRCWANPSWSQTCLDWRSRVDRSNSHNRERVPPHQRFPWLRVRQRDAFNLPGWGASFLWGPPGTGKTTTLGAVLASYLVTFPQTKVLLFSTTNSAVDQALVATDKALEQIGQESFPVRKHCVRLGNHFVASNYTGREHLLPVKDTALVEKLAGLEAQKPDPQNLQAYAAWKSSVELVRPQIRQQSAAVLEGARLAALTTTRGAFSVEDLQTRSPYDLVVFDEASQVSLVHALALAPLSKCCLFAGDPKQLAPVVRSNHALALTWLGNSMFSIMEPGAPSTCFLDEQSRMAEPICRLVSNVFYDGKLKLAADCQNDPKWKGWRVLRALPGLSAKPSLLISTAAAGKWSQKYHGPIRYESAELICRLVQEICRSIEQRDVIVLTPFRAQRVLIRSFLRHAGLKKVSVSTVHRAQGSERHTVIFDPVAGENDFLQTEDAKRLVNVALSRAQARLVLVLSPVDRTNPIFNQLATILDDAADGSAKRSAKSIGEFASRDDYPDCLLNQVISYKSVIGKVVQIEASGRYIDVVDLGTGRTLTFSSELIRREFQTKAAPARPVEVPRPPTPPKPSLTPPQNPARAASTQDILGGCWRST